MLNIDTSEVLQRISLDVAERYNYPQLVNEAAVEGVLGHPHQNSDRYYDEEHQRLRTWSNGFWYSLGGNPPPVADPGN